ncbi:1-aminocyclopropane-1-carboxylate deaminase/D-cysteine desulfhydrase [Streptomyces showdoensis]|uniref:1-aminocyclopropane-1-carboxylate deaminase n=1 Tax=Streptomyces showdoensis TaxID=68268 RepID=A0A2P2GE32_STREW|nr:pyridoxal-phosphate dependent enzyme [Streptomyces showdoensis]KKZ69788.1 1-aminocyclopropane-1-carboxylate deaminase [Streptomyces showdoensis]
MTRRPLLHRHWPALADTLPYLPLGSGPTPVRPLTGPGSRTPVWVKDESGYGEGGWGGNKVRKLEWLLPQALRGGGPRTLLSVGGLGTNWGLAAALYAREQGIDVALALIDQPVDAHVRAQLARLRASGATLHFPHTKGRLILSLPWLLARHTRGLRLPYVLPAGGSSPLGTLGYVECALELAEQVEEGLLPEPAWIVTAVGSGGTAAGLALGLRLAGLRTRVLAVVVNDTLRLDAARLTALAGKAERLLRARGAELPPTPVRLGPEDIVTEYGWLGEGYAHPTEPGARALRWAAEEADLELEPVYTAKALAALLALAGEGAEGAEGAEELGGAEGTEGCFGGGPVVFLNTFGPRPDGS